MSKCPKCGGPAYLGFTKVECATGVCPNFSKKYADEQTQSSQAPKSLSKTVGMGQPSWQISNGQQQVVIFNTPKPTLTPPSLFQVGEKVDYIGQSGDPLYNVLAGATGHIKALSSLVWPIAYSVDFGAKGTYSLKEKEICLSPSLAVAGTVNPKFNVGDKVRSTLSYLAGTVTRITLSPKIEYVVYGKNGSLYFFEDELELDVIPVPPPPGPQQGRTVGQNPPAPVANTIVVGSFVYLKVSFKRFGIQTCAKGIVVNILYGIPHDTVMVSWPAAPMGNPTPYSRDELELWP